MKGIYEFFWDCGRQGDLSGIFVADSEDVAKVIGKNVYFGEVLGRHSEVYGIVEEGDIELKTDNQEFVTQFISILGEDFQSGFNPVEVYNEREADNSEEEYED